jgi:hypothetical protein
MPVQPDYSMYIYGTYLLLSWILSSSMHLIPLRNHISNNMLALPLYYIASLGSLQLTDLLIVGITAPWNIDLSRDLEIRNPDQYFHGVPTLLSLYIYGISSLSGRDWSSSNNSILCCAYNHYHIPVISTLIKRGLTSTKARPPLGMEMYYRQQ